MFSTQQVFACDQWFAQTDVALWQQTAPGTTSPPDETCAKVLGHQLYG